MIRIEFFELILMVNEIKRKNNGKKDDIVVIVLILSYLFIVIILISWLIDCSILFSKSGIKKSDIDC